MPWPRGPIAAAVLALLAAGGCGVPRAGTPRAETSDYSTLPNLKRAEEALSDRITLVSSVPVRWPFSLTTNDAFPGVCASADAVRSRRIANTRRSIR